MAFRSVSGERKRVKLETYTRQMEGNTLALEHNQWLCGGNCSISDSVPAAAVCS